MDEIRFKQVSEIDLESSFFHYTNSSNIESIFRNGLEPRIGKNSKGIEKSRKVFFSIGEKNVLILMDAWIKWLILRPKSTFIYRCGIFCMTNSCFPRIVVDTIFKNWIKRDSKINYAIKKLNNILENSVFLVLNLEEGKDFSYDDIDEVKNQKYSRNQLKYIYSYDSNVNNSKQEPWNMHTFFNINIASSKISMLQYNDSVNANKILMFMIERNIAFVENSLPFLSKYYKYISN